MKKLWPIPKAFDVMPANPRRVEILKSGKSTFRSDKSDISGGIQGLADHVMAREELISLRQESLASQPLAPGSVEAQKMIDGSGRRLIALYGNFIQGGSSLRMFVEFLALKGEWFSTICFLNWKAMGTKSKHLLFQLAPSMPRTEETGFGLWPTPSSLAGEGEFLKDCQTVDGKPPERNQRVYDPNTGNHIQVNLNRAVKMWPTPRANDPEKRGDFNETDPRNGLPGAVKMWGTPRVDDSKNNGGISEQKRHGPALNAQAGGSLNPTFVEWMMGYPKNWTEVE
jgi:DNA (cytosine-5)-methyltransferase 1